MIGPSLLHRQAVASSLDRRRNEERKIFVLLWWMVRTRQDKTLGTTKLGTCGVVQITSVYTVHRPTRDVDQSTFVYTVHRSTRTPDKDTRLAPWQTACFLSTSGP